MKKKAETKKCAKAVKTAEAKSVKIAKQGSVLLERTDKVVTRDKNTVLKIFGPSYKVSAILNEAMNEVAADRGRRGILEGAEREESRASPALGERGRL